MRGNGKGAGTEGLIYVQALDVRLNPNDPYAVKVFNTSGTLEQALPYNGSFPPAMTFRGPQNIYFADGSYLDASQPVLVRRNAAGSIIETYGSSDAPPWTGE